MVSKFVEHQDNQVTSKPALPSSVAIYCILYLVGITLAELATTFLDPSFGLVTHSFLLVLILVHAALTNNQVLQTLLLSLIIAPLIRLLSLSLPLSNFPYFSWYIIVSVPIFVATFTAMRALGYSASYVGLRLRWREIPVQLMIALTGLIFGFAEYAILRPTPIVTTLTWELFITYGLVLLIGTGLMEELVFRGLMQRTAERAIGRWSIIYIALIFTALHIGWQSAIDLLFVFIAGIFWGFVAYSTRSIVGVTISHGITNIMLFVVLPALFPIRVVDSNVNLAPMLATSAPLQFSVDPLSTGAAPGVLGSGGSNFESTPLAASTDTPAANLTPTPNGTPPGATLVPTEPQANKPAPYATQAPSHAPPT